MPKLLPDLDVSRETIERLKRYEALIIKWQKAINLVSNDTVAQIWDRHIVDSAQLFAVIDVYPKAWIDIGSGAGLPGVVNAILLAELSPDSTVTLVESDQRKATFLRTALRECDVGGEVINDRVEKVDPAGADILTARALASVDQLLHHACRHLIENGTAILHKGRNFQQELDLARASWNYDVTLHQSLTDPDARLLELRNITRAKP